MLRVLPAECMLPCSLAGALCHSAGIALQVMEEIVQRTASAMVDRGTPFSGVLFAGLMIKDGKVHSSLPVSQRTVGKETSSPADPAQSGENFMGLPPLDFGSQP